MAKILRDMALALAEARTFSYLKGAPRLLAIFRKNPRERRESPSQKNQLKTPIHFCIGVFVFYYFIWRLKYSSYNCLSCPAPFLSPSRRKG